jgi:hypothetical protein
LHEKGVAKANGFLQCTNQGNTDTGKHDMKDATKFLAQNPTLLDDRCNYLVYFVVCDFRCAYGNLKAQLCCSETPS